MSDDARPFDDMIDDPTLIERAHRALAVVDGLAVQARRSGRTGGVLPLQCAHLAHAQALATVAMAESLDAIRASLAAEVRASRRPCACPPRERSPMGDGTCYRCAGVLSTTDVPS